MLLCPLLAACALLATACGTQTKLIHTPAVTIQTSSVHAPAQIGYPLIATKNTTRVDGPDPMPCAENRRFLDCAANAAYSPECLLGVSRQVLQANRPQRRAHRERHELDLLKLQQMVDYAEGNACRWQALLHYFGSDEELAGGRCGHCDYCAPELPLGQTA